MAEPSVSDQAAPSRRGGRLVARARAHKLAATIIAVAGFLGLGGIFGQWAVDHAIDLFEGEKPPAGFEELHGAWSDTADLSERLRRAGIQVNDTLTAGVPNTGRMTPPELQVHLDKLRAINRDASALAGRIRATDTELRGPRADLARLVALLRHATALSESGVHESYINWGGDPVVVGSGGFTPIFSNELREDVSTQDALKRQVAAGLAPTARRFERTVPEIRGWNRLVFYYNTDTPTF
jgi:hypothetical protein